MKTILTFMLACTVWAASAQVKTYKTRIQNATVTIVDDSVKIVEHKTPVAKKKVAKKLDISKKPSRSKSPIDDVTAVNADNKKQDTAKVAVKSAAPDSIKLSLQEYSELAGVVKGAIEDAVPAATLRAMGYKQQLEQFAGIIFNVQRVPSQLKAPAAPAAPERKALPEIATPKTDSLKNNTPPKK